MTKIAMYNVSPVEVPYIDDWAKKNDVEVKTTDKPLTMKFQKWCQLSRHTLYQPARSL